MVDEPTTKEYVDNNKYQTTLASVTHIPIMSYTDKAIIQTILQNMKSSNYKNIKLSR